MTTINLGDLCGNWRGSLPPALTAAGFDDAKHPHAPHSGKFIPTGHHNEGGQAGAEVEDPSGVLSREVPDSAPMSSLEDAVENWVESPWLVPNHAVAAAVKDGGGSNKFANALARKLQSDPDTSPEIYRAMSSALGDERMNGFLADAEAGSVTLDPSSFSKKKAYVLKSFSGDRMDQHIVSVLISVKAGSKGLDVDKVFRVGEGEVISGGRYRVAGMSSSVESHMEGTREHSLTSYQVELEQEQDFAPDSAVRAGKPAVTASGYPEPEPQPEEHNAHQDHSAPPRAGRCCDSPDCAED
jgi:hypothetical protein